MPSPFEICLPISHFFLLDLTLTFFMCIMIAMKRISTRKNSFVKRLLINIPFVLIVALIAACFLSGAILVFYCFVTAVAFHSAMVSLILVGAGLLLVGAGLGLIVAFKRYYAFYDKQMGWQYPDRAVPAEKSAVDGKKPLKAYFSLSNFALLFLAIGAVLTVISAALGCISRDKWIAVIGPYREQHGYFQDVRHMQLKFAVEDSSSHEYTLREINVDLLSKEAVIIFTDDPQYLGYLTLDAYVSYEGQLSCACDSQPISYFTISEKPAPSARETALDKLLFFADDILKSVPSEKQIIIYLPSELEDNIVVDGPVIYAK